HEDDDLVLVSELGLVAEVRARRGASADDHVARVGEREAVELAREVHHPRHRVRGDRLGAATRLARHDDVVGWGRRTVRGRGEHEDRAVAPRQRRIERQRAVLARRHLTETYARVARPLPLTDIRSSLSEFPSRRGEKIFFEWTL